MYLAPVGRLHSSGSASVIWLAMVGASSYGWLALPADARVPVHFGPFAYNNFVPKRIGLRSIRQPARWST
jgi:hypothetical protein